MRLLTACLLLLQCLVGPAFATAPEAEKPPVPLPAAVQRPVRVGVAVVINTVTKVTDQQQTFETSFDLQLRWTDPSLAFDALTVGVDRREFAAEAATARLQTMWYPQVTLVNIQDKPSKYENGLIVHADGSVTYIQRYKCVLDTKFRLAAFPFDSQSLPLKFLMARESVGEVVFAQDQKDIDNSRISSTATIGGWKLEKLEFTPSAQRGWNGAYYSTMDVDIRARRRPGNHVPIIFIPFLLIMVAPSVMTLFTKGDVAPRITAWGQSILAMIAFNFTLSIRYPGLGSDTFMSELFTIGFGFQTIMIIFTTTWFNPAMQATLGGEDLVSETTAWLRWCLPLLLVGLIAYRILLLQAG